MSSNGHDRRQAPEPGKLEPVAGRVPPSDLDAEGAVLSACLLEPEALDVVRDILAPVHCYADANRRILEAIYDLHDLGKPADIVSVAGVLRDKGRLDQIGGTPYLAQLSDAVPFIANVGDYARRVREKFRVRCVISACQKTAADGYGDIGDADEWIGRVEHDVLAATQDDSPSDAAEPIGAVLRRVSSAMTARQRGEGGGATGIVAGTPALTRLIDGYQRGMMYVLAARPGMGKSAKALQDAIEVAKTGEHAVFVSAEMPKEQLSYRAIALVSRVDSRRIKSGTLNRDEWARVTAAMAELDKLPLTLYYRPGATVPQIEAAVRRAHAEARKRFGSALKLGLVAVDYIQILAGRGDNREQEVASLSLGLQRFGGKSGAVILALSQLNRGVEGRQDKRPGLSDLRESGAIEQDAYGIMFIYRDEYYNRDTTEKGVAEIIVAKNRDGQTGVVKQAFTPQYTRFDDLAPEVEEVHQFDDFGDDPRYP